MTIDVQSEIWTHQPLGNLGDCIRGVTYSPEKHLSDQDTNDSVRLLRSNNIQGTQINIDSIQFVDRGCVSTRQELKNGDILLCMANGSKALVGKAAKFLAPTDHVYTFGAFMGVFRPRNPEDSDYVLFLTQSKKFRDYLDVALSGSSINNLRPSDILRMQFAIPEVSERKTIASTLRDIDDLVIELNTLITKKGNIKQGVMQQLLTGRVRLSGFQGDDIHLDETPVGWKQMYVRDLLQRVRNLPKSVASSEILKFGSIPVVDQGKHLVAGFINDDVYKCKCPEGGLLIFGDHTRVVKFIDFNFATGADGTQVLAQRMPLNMRFITYAIQNHEIPNTGYNRHYKYLAELEIFVPKLEEQNAIAKVLSDMDKEIEALAAQRDKSLQVKTGMMQTLLTGKVRL